MQKNMLFATAVVMLTMFGACTEDPPIATNGQLQDVATMPASALNREFTIQNVTLNGDVLTFEVSHNCGCGSNDFNLYGGGIDYSNPPHTDIYLALTGEDLCEALCHKTLSFNISLLKEILNNEGPLRISVHRYGSGFLYEF